MAEDQKEEPFPTRLKGKGVVHLTGTDDSSPEMITLRNTLRAWHWAGYKRVFDIAAVIAPTDRSWNIVHGQIMDVGAEQERSLETILARLLPQAKEKEQGK